MSSVCVHEYIFTHIFTYTHELNFAQTETTI